MREHEYSMNEGIEMVESKPEIEVTKINEGFGFGEGSISFRTRTESVGPEVIARVEAAIESSEILIPVSKDKLGNRLQDDGCSDGRGVKRVFMGAIEKVKSLYRAKVFGGGATMVSAMEIGSGAAYGRDLQEVFSTSIDTMKDKQIDFGAHTDEHAHGDDCGCGAIDKAPSAMANVVKYADDIVETIASLGVDTEQLPVVMDNFTKYAEEIKGQIYSGKKVADTITSKGKVVKELRDHHCEAFVLLNTAEGYTVNQELIREVSNDTVQVFAVDVWRLQELAMKRYPDDLEAQNMAFLSELVYTLGVSATLTAGDLPVRQLSQKQYSLVA